MPRGRRRMQGRAAVIRSAELIGWALGGLEREIAETRQRLAALTAQANQLRRRAGRSLAAGAIVDAKAASGPRRRRKLSAEARKRISERMTKRWAEWRKKHSKA